MVNTPPLILFTTKVRYDTYISITFNCPRQVCEDPRDLKKSKTSGKELREHGEK